MFQKLRHLNLLKKFKLVGVERSIIFIVAFILFVVANVLFSTISLRFDGSQGKAYTLSSATKKILGSVDDIVTIHFFVSSEIPTKLLPLKTEVIDLLNEYKKQNNKIQVKVLDPKKDSSAASEAQGYGIPELQFSQLESDKYNVTASPFGLALSYGNKQEVIPQATDITSLEYSITAALYKLTRKELPTIGIVGDAETINESTDEHASLRTVLNQQFNVDNLDISSNSATTTIDPKIKTLLVFDNNVKQYTKEELQKIKEYLDTKGKVIAFADGVWVANDLSQTQPAKHNLFDLFSEYGITLHKDLLLSNSYEMVNFGNEVVSFVSPYPFWIKTGVLNQQTANSPNVSHLTLPWVSSLTLQKRKDFMISDVVKTPKDSWEQTSNFTLQPQTIKAPEDKDLKDFVVAAQSQKKNGGQLIVIATSRLANEDFVKRGNDNLEFVLNVVNNVASNGILSGIRKREVNLYPLPHLSENQKDTFKLATIALLPGLFALFGVLKLLRRR
jgi:ABC-type uncharacterized transport system involved in gliding motility auxiliary subunit